MSGDTERCDEVCPETLATMFGLVAGAQCSRVKGHPVFGGGLGHCYPWWSSDARVSDR